MRKTLLATAALGLLALAPLLSTGVQAANLVQNGGFETNTLPTLNPANASGAEVDNKLALRQRSARLDITGASTYNILFFGNVANAEQYRRGYSLHGL